MSIRLLNLALLALIAGCATRLPSTGFAEPAALERAMNRYYESHATEEHGHCLTPHIDGLTQVAVVDEPARPAGGGRPLSVSGPVQGRRRQQRW